MYTFIFVPPWGQKIDSEAAENHIIFWTPTQYSTPARFEMNWMKTFAVDRKHKIWPIFGPPWAKYLATQSKIYLYLTLTKIVHMSGLK